MKVANIHEAPNGTWHITDNALDYLDERGIEHGTERQAIKIGAAFRRVYAPSKSQRQDREAVIFDNQRREVNLRHLLINNQ